MSANPEDSSKKKKKSMGPHGLGDPDDKSLRRTEKTLLIPQKRREIVNKEYCNKEIEVYQECVLKYGLLKSPLKCSDLKVTMSDCMEHWNESPEINKRARLKYLEERSEYRRTGLCEENRKFFSEYLNNKEKT